MIVFNEDFSNYFINYALDEMNNAALREYVNQIAATSVTDIFFNVNGQRATFDSKAREPVWYGYDPSNPDDSSFFSKSVFRDPNAIEYAKKQQVQNAYELYRRGINPYKVWLDECRRVGVNGWISMRMNDIHGAHDDTFYLHNEFWRSNPQFRRGEYRALDGWWEMRALDYGREEVRNFAMKFVRECLELYPDMTGFEFDWLRMPYCFRPGFEEEGIELLNSFMQEAAQACRRAGVKVAVRVPQSPDVSLALGFDVWRWAHEGWVDTVTACSRYSSTSCNAPIALWKRLFSGTGVKFLAGMDAQIRPHPYEREQSVALPVVYAFASAFYSQRPDGLYLFNYFPRRNAPNFPEEDVKTALDGIGFPERLRFSYRRHIVSYDDQEAFGDKNSHILPLKLHPHGCDIRLNLGAAKGTAVRILSDEKCSSVWLNTFSCNFSGTLNSPEPNLGKPMYVYCAPSEAAHDGFNIITLAADEDVIVNWVEVEINF